MGLESGLSVSPAYGLEAPLSRLKQRADTSSLLRALRAVGLKAEKLI